MSNYKEILAKEILDRAERIPYNPEWTLLEQNQLHAAKALAEEVLVAFGTGRRLPIVQKVSRWSKPENEQEAPKNSLNKDGFYDECEDDVK